MCRQSGYGARQQNRLPSRSLESKSGPPAIKGMYHRGPRGVTRQPLSKHNRRFNDISRLQERSVRAALLRRLAAGHRTGHLHNVQRILCCPALPTLQYQQPRPQPTTAIPSQPQPHPQPLLTSVKLALPFCLTPTCSVTSSPGRSTSSNTTTACWGTTGPSSLAVKAILSALSSRASGVSQAEGFRLGLA